MTENTREEIEGDREQKERERVMIWKETIISVWDRRENTPWPLPIHIPWHSIEDWSPLGGSDVGAHVEIHAFVGATFIEPYE